MNVVALNIQQVVITKHDFRFAGPYLHDTMPSKTFD